ncbi:glutamine synthetase family protein [Aeromonas schubertii]|uniref:glutamine synthetase family protein n=1 Tax=Aeromonas schubertii TaxID=652 RepID=UPI0010A7DAC5|nr:glutamine synthetase family protein [Aeromonas schubertii]QCG47255.1 glutamine synthetase [Aeromonas schubertii]
MGDWGTLEEAEAFLAAHPEVEAFEIYLIDLAGISRGKLLRREELLPLYHHGRPLPSSILALTVNGEDVDETGLVWDVADMDCLARPVAGSLTLLPWRRVPTGALQLSLDPVAGLPAALADPRHALTRVIDTLAARDLYPVMAVELEFYLLDREDDPFGRPQPARLGDGRRPREPQVYGVRELALLEPFLADLYAACRLQGLPARTAISEYAPGQVEITLEHGPALLALDQGVRYKRLVKGLAETYGMQACFMAKPFGHLAGSGLHLHVSLADAEGNNRFAAEDPHGSPLLRAGIGGLLETLAESLLFFCPHANSYRRFQAHSYAPLAPTWGVNNRTVSLRIPGGPPESRHLEHRISGADANPYLVATCVLAGLLRGIDEQCDPGAPVVGNGYLRGASPAPHWQGALAAARASPWLERVFGTDFMGVWLAIKEAEQRRFFAEVGEQDWRWYRDTV